MKLEKLTIMLETENLNGTIMFYTKTLGFECENTFPPDSDTPDWAILGKDGASIMFCVRNAHSTVKDPVMTGTLYFNVDDASEAWEQLKDKVTVEYPIEDYDYGMREFAIRDCNGYILQFGQELQQEQ